MKNTKIVSISLLCCLLALAQFGWCNGDRQGSSGKKDTVTFFMLTFNNIPDDYSQVVDAINKHILFINRGKTPLKFSVKDKKAGQASHATPLL